MFGFLGKTIAKISVPDTPGVMLTADTTKRVVSINVGRYAGEQVVVWSGGYTETPMDYINNRNIGGNVYHHELYNQQVYPQAEEHERNDPDPNRLSPGTIPGDHSSRIDYAVVFGSATPKSFDFYIYNPEGVALLALGAGHRDLFKGGAGSTEYVEPVVGMEQCRRVYIFASDHYQKAIYHTAIGKLPPHLKALYIKEKRVLEIFPVLPATLEYLVVVRGMSLVHGPSIIEQLENCIQLKSIVLGVYQVGTNVGLSADWSDVVQIDLSYHTQLTRLMTNGVDADLLLPSNHFEVANIANNPGLTDAAGVLRSLLAPGNSFLVVWSTVNCPNYGAGEVWTLTSADLADSSLLRFHLHGAMAGSIDFSVALPLVAVSISNAMETIDLTGLDSLTHLHLNNCPNLAALNLTGLDSLTDLHLNNCSNLAALNLTGLDSLTHLYLNNCPNLAALNLTGLTGLEHFVALGSDRLMDNSPTLQRTLEAQAGLTYLRSSCAFADLDLSNTKVNNRHTSIRNMTGTLTLPAAKHGTGIPHLGFLYLNPGLTAVENMAVHDAISSIHAANCTLFNPDLTQLPHVNSYQLSNTGITTADLSQRVSESSMFLHVHDCAYLEEIILPTTPGNARIAGFHAHQAYFHRCPLLASVIRPESLSFEPAFRNRLYAFDCPLLDMSWPLGEMDGSGIPPNEIGMENNNMSVANVDATIASIAENESKWDYYTTNGHTKLLNIGGTNARPTGTHQPPPGNDPIGADAMEQVYWLVNERGWIITTS